MKAILTLFCALFGVFSSAQSASVVVNWSTDRAFHDASNHNLTAGTSADGDGALIQLGYFSLGTPVDPFAGAWTVLAVGSIGDQGNQGDGYFSITTILGEDAIVAPAVGTPLGVRFYDGLSIADSSYNNTGVNMDDTGRWQDPGNPAPAIDLALSKGITESEGDLASWTTYLPVPEPSVALLGCVAMGGLVVRRKKGIRSV